MSQYNNILLTGSTGILGSHILYELLEKYASGEWIGKLALLIRSSRCVHEKPEKRLEKVLSENFIPDFLRKYDKHHLLQPVFVINGSVNDFSIEQLPADFYNLIVLHAAGSVNLGNDRLAYKDVSKNNLQASLHLLDEILPRTKKFCYVSTAYSSGHREGLIGDNFLDHNSCVFRNPYEEFKSKVEYEVIERCTSLNKMWQIFRPGIICGRLLDYPLYLIPRFTVFYLIGKFVHLLQRNTFGETHLQIYAPEESGLNIIPVDYVAKAIVRAIGLKEQQINFVHSTNVNSHQLFENGFETMEYRKYSLLEKLPEKLSIADKLYHKVINSQLLPYLETPSHQFDSTKVREIMTDIPEPDVTNHFSDLVRFAVDHRFKNLF